MFQGMYWGRKIFNLNIKGIDLEACFYLEHGLEFIVHFIHFYFLYAIVFHKLLLKAFKKQDVFLWILIFVLIFYFRGYANVLFYNAFEGMCKLSPCSTIVVQWLHVANTLIVSGLSVMVFMTINLIKTQKQKIDLITQNRESEQALLRAQINPHFLFNTLNNIYYLTNKKSDKASAAIMRLSEIMRYMIKDSSADRVPLEKEIAYIQGFVDLHKLRIQDDDLIVLSINGQIKGHYIAPMLLICFVENAFKYGTHSTNLKGIVIKLNVNNNDLVFKVDNYYDPNQDIQGGGFGLQNVKRRLELIYPNRFNLQIWHNSVEKKHQVVLTIKLKNEDELYCHR
jgi:LytS/YehU family sensor histidine kinase